MSGTDVHSVSLYPCSVAIPNYSIAPDGKISSCTLTFNDRRKIAEKFVIGKIKNGTMKLDQRAIKSMESFNILNMSGCKSCFAKWHCKGGCVYAKGFKWRSPMDPKQCEMIKFVLKEKLLWLMDR